MHYHTIHLAAPLLRISDNKLKLSYHGRGVVHNNLGIYIHVGCDDSFAVAEVPYIANLRHEGHMDKDESIHDIRTILPADCIDHQSLGGSMSIIVAFDC